MTEPPGTIAHRGARSVAVAFPLLLVLVLPSCDPPPPDLLHPQVPHCVNDSQCVGRYGEGWFCASDAGLPEDNDHCLPRGVPGDATDATSAE